MAVAVMAPNDLFIANEMAEKNGADLIGGFNQS